VGAQCTLPQGTCRYPKLWSGLSGVVGMSQRCRGQHFNQVATGLVPRGLASLRITNASRNLANNGLRIHITSAALVVGGKIRNRRDKGGVVHTESSHVTRTCRGCS
jgi:CheY-specific phosphatase CheX